MLRLKPAQGCILLLALQLIQCDLMLPLLGLFLKTQWSGIKWDSKRRFCINTVLCYSYSFKRNEMT